MSISQRLVRRRRLVRYRVDVCIVVARHGVRNSGCSTASSMSRLLAQQKVQGEDDGSSESSQRGCVHASQAFFVCSCRLSASSKNGFLSRSGELKAKKARKSEGKSSKHLSSRVLVPFLLDAVHTTRSFTIRTSLRSARCPKNLFACPRFTSRSHVGHAAHHPW